MKSYKKYTIDIKVHEKINNYTKNAIYTGYRYAIYCKKSKEPVSITSY